MRLTKKTFQHSNRLLKETLMVVNKHSHRIHQMNTGQTLTVQMKVASPQEVMLIVLYHFWQPVRTLKKIYKQASQGRKKMKRT